MGKLCILTFFEQVSTADPALVALARQSDLEGARRWFTSYGSCSITEPVDDLVGLGLLEAPHE